LEITEMIAQKALQVVALSVALMAAQSLGLPGAAQAQRQGPPVAVTGEFEVILIDRLEQGRADLHYFVRDRSSGETFELRFDGRPPGHLRTGQMVTARGRAEGRRLWVTELAEGDASTGGPAGTQDSLAVDTNLRKAVVLLVNLIDKSASASVATATSHMFTGENSVARTYAETSYGQVSIPADTDGDGQPDVFGPFDVDYSASGCDYRGWGYAADDAASAAGIDLSLYQHRVYVTPSACGWLGVANVGCGSVCRAWILAGGRGPTYAHEFGHNLGMRHAVTDPENDGVVNNEYGDLSDPLGSSSGGWRGNNSAHKDQLGWLNAFAGSSLTVVSSGSYDIYPLALDPATAGGPQSLKIHKPDSNEIYYLSYRRPVGIDSAIKSTYTGGASVHRYRGSGSTRTYLIKVLGDGGQFDDPVNGITVTQLGRAADGSFVTVNVDFGCAVGTPSVSLSPSSTGLPPGGSASLTVSLTNNDVVGCPETTFDLADLYDPGLSGRLSVSQMMLMPGETGTAALQVAASTADGSYGATVQAVDADGFDPQHGTVGATAMVTVDATAPLPPSGLTASLGSRGDQVDLVWNPASDSGGSGIDHYRVFRDAGAGFVEIAQSPSESYSDRSVAFETTYGYLVTAVDRAANESADSGTATVTTGKAKAKGGGSNGGGGKGKGRWK
jgi:hypothetical protein